MPSTSTATTRKIGNRGDANRRVDAVVPLSACDGFTNTSVAGAHSNAGFKRQDDGALPPSGTSPAWTVQIALQPL